MTTKSNGGGRWDINLGSNIGSLRDFKKGPFFPRDSFLLQNEMTFLLFGKIYVIHPVPDSNRPFPQYIWICEVCLNVQDIFIKNDSCSNNNKTLSTKAGQAWAGKEGTRTPLLLRTAFTVTQPDGLKLTRSVNNSNPWAWQVLMFQCWFTINPATEF